MSASRGKVFGSRRLVLAAAFAMTALGGAALGGAARRAAAQVQVSRADAKYQDTPHGGLSCQACSFFRRPMACQVVAGKVSPHGWCKLFDMPD